MKKIQECSNDDTIEAEGGFKFEYSNLLQHVLEFKRLKGKFPTKLLINTYIYDMFIETVDISKRYNSPLECLSKVWGLTVEIIDEFEIHLQ